MPNIRIAVVSDLHIGDAARATDLHVAARKKDAGNVDRDDFLSRFNTFITDAGLQADFLLVPGDITNRATPEEFDLAAKIVRQVAQSVGVKFENVIFIPGNHDVDWSVLKGSNPHPLRLAQRFDPFGSFAKHFPIASTSMTAAPYFAHYQWDSLCVVAYNSAWHDQPNVPAAHHGRVDSDHMRLIADQFNKHPPKPDAVRLFIVHHHPFQYMDFLRDWDDFSIMQNVEALYDLLTEFKFDLVVHGHKHYPNFNTQVINAGHPIAILGAGSFCRVLDSRWNGIVANQFHLIEIEKRDAGTGSICGQVRSWAYLASSGWDRSYHTKELDRARRRGTGIEYEKTFGFYCTPLELLTLVSEVIQKTLGNKPLITLTEMLTAEPRLRFAPVEALEKALRDFAANSPYDFVPTEHEKYLVQGDKS